MNIFQRFVSGLGAQNMPYGLAPNDPQASYRAGLQYMGDLGSRLMANNQGGVSGGEILGASMTQAKEMSRQRAKEDMAAKVLFDQAEENRRKREEEAKQREKQNAWLQSLSAPDRAMLEANPGLMEDYVKATNDTFQTADAGTTEYGLNPVPIADANGNFVGMGQMSKSGGLFFNGEQVDGKGLRAMDPGSLAETRSRGTFTGKAPEGVVEEYTKKIRPAIEQTASALAAVDESERLLQNVETGSGAEVAQALRGWGATLGLNVDETVLADTQAYQNFISQVVIPRMQALGGNDSNEELRYLKSTMGGDITQSRAAIQATLSLTRKLLQKRMQTYRATEQYVLPYLEGLPAVPDFTTINPGSDGGPDLSTMTDDQLEAIINGQ